MEKTKGKFAMKALISSMVKKVLLLDKTAVLHHTSHILAYTTRTKVLQKVL